MANLRKRIDRIKRVVEIEDLLADYGYKIHGGGGHREQQFQCDLHGDGRDGKPSARMYPESQSWYCVSEKVLVLTAQGWRPFGAARECPEMLDGAGVYQTPMAFIPKGVRPCIRIQTKPGYEVTLTKDHEVEVQGKGWVPAGMVRLGDALQIVVPQDPQFAQSARIPVDAFRYNNRKYKGHPPLRLPTEWNLSLGEVLGYIFGDGWVTLRPGTASNMVGLTSGSEDQTDARQIFEVFQTWAGGRGSETHRTGKVRTPNGVEYTEDQYVFSIGNDDLCTWLTQLGLKNAPVRDRRLPHTLWGATRDALRGFLRGVYATDGSVFRPKDRSGIKVNLYSISPGFLQDIQLVLLQFGVRSRLYPAAKKRPTGVWYLQLATGHDILVFRERVGIANSRKAAILASFEYNPRGTRPFTALVARIDPAGDQVVADVTMPGSPTFVAGGIKVHNCFACDKSRDAIETVRAKEGLSLPQALSFLEQKYKLPFMASDDNDEAYQTPLDSVSARLNTQRSFADEIKMLVGLLETATELRHLSVDLVVAYWEAVDKLSHHVGEKLLGERTAQAAVVRLYDKLLQAMRDGYAI